MIPIPQAKTLSTPEVVQIPNINNTTDALKAYSLCYDEEQRLLQQQETGRPLTNIRILGYMFIHNSGSSMLTELTRAVTSCFQVPDGHAKRLNDLGQFFLDYWIRPFRITGRTPCSSHPSRPSFELKASETSAELKPPSNDNSTAKKQALARDGYRCILTGLWDSKTIESNPTVALLYRSSGGKQTHTECAHIFSKSTNLGLDNEAKKAYAGHAWAVLKCFGYNTIFDELNGSGVHRLENVLTLSLDYHLDFNELKLWFEPIDMDDPNSHSYNVYGNCDYLSTPPDEITFINHAYPGVDIPLPSKRYLSIHATCCKVAAMSGAGEYLDKVIRDQETISVLATDGSSADVISNAIFQAYHTQLEEPYYQRQVEVN